MSDYQEALESESEEHGQVRDEPVTCLGMTFENDEARRAYFTEELARKLQEPEFRKIEGFPIGEDEDILNLSDPPYYTACPNPWIGDFIAEWETQKPTQPEGYHYHREPFAADVSEGKNDPIYNAHSYHTKVPHKAIMRYILHYTEPGDIVFDGFCGTGMTGVAAQMCGDKSAVISLGYQVKPDGTILQEEIDEAGKNAWMPFSRLGARRAVLNDLSPAATFIAYNYNTPVNVVAFEKEARRILQEVEEECGWMYETIHTDGKTKGRINYTVWSDVFVCPECTGEVVFWDEAVDAKNGKVLDDFPCPHCSASLTKRKLDRAWGTLNDRFLGETIRQAKQIPALINYSVGGKRYKKKPDEVDLAILEKIWNEGLDVWFPINRMIEGHESRRNDPVGITHTHHFYSPRNLSVMSKILNLVDKPELTPFKFGFLNTSWHATQMRQYNPAGGHRPRTGTLYMPSIHSEGNMIPVYKKKLNQLVRFYKTKSHRDRDAIIQTMSSTVEKSNKTGFDYVFIDPPFGANLNYSELNSIWEAWLKVSTNNTEEAIENRYQNKGIDEYRLLMTRCFRQAYSQLKPGHWMTIEFSNTSAGIWNNIQTAISDAGFIVANISVLNKKQGSIMAYTTPTAVKQDLVISAYKPNDGFEERFQKEAKTAEGAWDFVRNHLKYLPVTKHQGTRMQFVQERDPRILFDQMVAWYVRKDFLVPVSSQEFQAGLPQRFIERDGMYFLPDQVAEYDRKKMISGELLQTSLFVSDEASAIQWLRQLIKEKPQTFSDINPQFMQQLGGWSKNEVQLDLRELLNQNFLCYNGKEPVPEQIHAYLSTNWKELRNLPKDAPALVAKARDRWYVPDPNKAGDLEKLREKSLLKEFEEYKKSEKRLKIFRLEAVRAGFKKAWQEGDYAVITTMADKIPNKILEEDPKLLMWYDQAVTRMGGE